MSEFKTPEKKVKIDETYNAERIDSGNYPKNRRQENSYNQYDFKDFRRDQRAEELFKRSQQAIYSDGKKRIPPPPGDQIVADLKNLEQYRRWGGLSKKIRSSKKNRTKRTRKNKHRKTTKK